MRGLLSADLIILPRLLFARRLGRFCEALPEVDEVQDGLISLKHGWTVSVVVFNHRLQSRLYNYIPPDCSTIFDYWDRWADDLAELLISAHLRRLNSPLKLFDREQLAAARRSTRQRLFLFDYDGTLTPIVSTPDAAVPKERTVNVLRQTAYPEANAAWVISGRDQAFLDLHLGDINRLGIVAEHGSFVRDIGSSTWSDLTETWDLSWQTEVWDAFDDFSRRQPGLHRERKKAALVLHFRKARPEFTESNAQECIDKLRDILKSRPDVEIVRGKKIIEVRPKLANKGAIASKLLRGESPVPGGVRREPPDFVFCAGDDVTDEDMFRAVRAAEPSHAFTCKVGEDGVFETQARHFALAPLSLVMTLQALAHVSKA